jgi:uncharacterized protein (DUF1501 family)
MNRRNFLQKTAFATAGTMLIPAFLKEFETVLPTQQAGEKILVVIQLSGGNDGLNTVVPFRNDIYYQKRPALAVPKTEVLKLNDDLGLNPMLKGVRNLYEKGFLSIINQVGYPNPDRSHFRSMDIWQTASSSSEYISSGWLGRYLDATCEGDCKIAHRVIEIDDTLSLALKGKKIKGLATTDTKKMYEATQNAHIQRLAQLASTHQDHEDVDYLYKTLAETVSSAEYLHSKTKTYNSSQTYPAHEFGQQLKVIAQLINAGAETSVYYTSLTGFDTHVNQQNQHERLLKLYSEAVEAFVKDLQSGGRWNDTVVMTFSEFGRRVAQNASRGTDHGTANNLFLMGGNLKKTGFWNEAPNLTDLDEGDLKFEIDFRNIYATLLQKHLRTDAKTILGDSFKVLEVL